MMAEVVPKWRDDNPPVPSDMMITAFSEV